MKVPKRTRRRPVRLGTNPVSPPKIMEMPMLPDTKRWTTSLTIWSVIVMLLPLIARILGYDLSQADASLLSDNVIVIAQAMAGLVAIYGRVRATKVIGKAA